MRFSPSFLDEIRQRLPVSAVVGRRVRLQKAGREWKGLSPFNAEKTPSFFVNDQKGFYHDFSSGRHGDVFTFLMEVEGLSFPEAVERLAGEAGLQMPKSSPEAEAEEKKRTTLLDVTEMAARFFEGQLQTSAAAEARAYLERRAIAAATQIEFRIGFAPDRRDGLRHHLLKNGISDAQAIAAGLVIQPDDGREPYDRFRGRILFPIQDMRGRVVSFGGRAMTDEAKPKYLNGPETELFVKGRTVFNGHRAREAAHKGGQLIVVEGYVDAIAVWQAGVRAVVATLGTAFTEEQISTLWRFSPEPVVCFDGDQAGRAAAFRAIDRILPQLRTGASFRFAFLPEGQDPDDLIRSGGKPAFAAILDRAEAFWDVLWRREMAGAWLATPDGQAVFEKRIRDAVAQIGDGLVRRRYELAARLRLSDLFWSLGRRGGKRSAAERPAAGGPAPAVESARHARIERILLGMAVHYPHLAEIFAEKLAAIQFRGEHAGEPFSTFCAEIVDLLAPDSTLRREDFYDRPRRAGFFATLDFLHGRAEGGKPSGHRLFARFPILASGPPEDFIERAFLHFIDVLILRDLEDDQRAALAAIGAEISDQQWGLLSNLTREIQQQREWIKDRDLALAEEASALRGAAPEGAGQGGIAALIASAA